MDKRFLLILAALVVIFGSIFWLTKSKSNAPGTGSSQAQASNHVLGEGNKVSLVEFGDYQCPACGQYFPIIEQIKAKYADQISFRFANFPLVQIHPNAMVAARAAEAASLQNKFWEMHDLLYRNQTTWAQASNPSSYFEKYAADLKLDITKFKADSASAGVLATINADVAEAQGYGATGTPTFILNGKKIDSPTSIEAFSEVIDQAIKQAKQ
ncbi:MAG: thioredoxin domain-containing protein [Candidatus Saccharimonadales bacterium]